MKNLLLLLFISFSYLLTGQEESVLNIDFQETILLEGDLKTGNKIPLDWAQSSQVACFPGTRFYEFKGNHVFYRIQMPAASDMKISVSPKNKKHRINIYALRLGENNMDYPPNISRAISCEAAYPIYVGKANLNKANKTKAVEYMSTTKSYTILIGVAGAQDVLEGAYELKIETRSR